MKHIVIGENETEYFIEYKYKGDYGERTDIDTIRKTDVFLNEADAEAEVKRLNEVAEYL